MLVISNARKFTSVILMLLLTGFAPLSLSGDAVSNSPELRFSELEPTGLQQREEIRVNSQQEGTFDFFAGLGCFLTCDGGLCCEIVIVPE